MEMLAAIIFVLMYVLIVSEKVHRTIVAMMGAILMIIVGIMPVDTALHHIDFNTLGLLIGMMILVSITAKTGLFDYVAIKTAKAAKAQPRRLLIYLGFITALFSAFLDNVTTVLLTVPITFSITAQLKVDVKPYLISQILASNIGGTATLIGDPPNIMIGSAVGLNFMDFLANLSGIAVLIFILVELVLIAIYGKELHTQPDLQEKVMRLNAKSQIANPALLKKCLFVIALTIGLFVVHGYLGLQTATAALSGAGLLLLITYTRNEGMITKVLSKIEWTAIFFFAGLFVLVGALVETGVIKVLAAEAIKLTNGSANATAMLILWMSAFASAFIDNIPFVATLIPLIQDMGHMGLSNLDPMWWSLALGACLGGNGTLIGASANVVVASMAAQRGKQISFLGFMKIAFPVMIMTIAVSSVYVWLRYLL